VLERTFYAGEMPMESGVKLGMRGYTNILAGAARMEKLRFNVHRVLHGLGSFETIP